MTGREGRVIVLTPPARRGYVGHCHNAQPDGNAMTGHQHYLGDVPDAASRYHDHAGLEGEVRALRSELRDLRDRYDTALAAIRQGMADLEGLSARPRTTDAAGEGPVQPARVRQDGRSAARTAPPEAYSLPVTPYDTVRNHKAGPGDLR